MQDVARHFVLFVHHGNGLRHIEVGVAVAAALV